MFGQIVIFGEYQSFSENILSGVKQEHCSCNVGMCKYKEITGLLGPRFFLLNFKKLFQKTTVNPLCFSILVAVYIPLTPYSQDIEDTGILEIKKKERMDELLRYEHSGFSRQGSRMHHSLKLELQSYFFSSLHRSHSQNL